QIKNYLLGPARDLIGGKIKELLTNYVVNHLVDKILGLLEKAYLPDHILEKFIEEALHYMITKMNVIVRNIFVIGEMEEDSREKMINDIYLYEYEEEKEKPKVIFFNWMFNDREEFDEERTNELYESLEDYKDQIKEESQTKSTEETEEKETRITYTTIETPQTTDNEQDNQMYDKMKNRNKYSKKPFSRRGKKQRIQEKGIRYGNKETPRRDPRQQRYPTRTIIQRPQRYRTNGNV